MFDFIMDCIVDPIVDFVVYYKCDVDDYFTGVLYQIVLFACVVAACISWNLESIFFTIVFAVGAIVCLIKWIKHDSDCISSGRK